MVAIAGTGGTAVEIVPHLAKWSKHLYVVQRTPASVGFRNQRVTDGEWSHKEVAGSKGNYLFSIPISIYFTICIFPLANLR